MVNMKNNTKKTYFIACEKYESYYREVIEELKLDDINYKKIKCNCDKGIKERKSKHFLDFKTNDNVIFKNGSNVSVDHEIDNFYEVKMNNCFEDVINKQDYQDLVNDGKFLITPDWLNNWKENLKIFGDEPKTIKMIFREFASAIVLIVYRINHKQIVQLNNLSEFFDLPTEYKIVSKVNMHRSIIRNLNNLYNIELDKKELRINKLTKNLSETVYINELMRELMSSKSKVDILEKTKSKLVSLMGASSVEIYLSTDEKNTSEYVNNLIKSDSNFIISIEKNKFIAISSKFNNAYLILEASGFFIPDRIEQFKDFGVQVLNMLEILISYVDMYNKELEKMSYMDQLTGIYNRRFFSQELSKIFPITKKHDDSIGIDMFDIDDFKSFNDNYGHDIGDQVLKAVAEVVSSTLKDTDSFARWGGEEFIILIPNITQKQLKSLGDKIRMNIFGIELEGVGKITVSSGLTLLTDDDTLETVLRRVDEALYLAKNSGKNICKLL